MQYNVFRYLAVIILLVSAGCGGGGGGVQGQQRAVLSFSLMSTSRLPFRLNAVQIDAELPYGLVPITGDPHYPRKITSGLETGGAAAGALNSGLTLFGSYSANHVRIIVVASNATQPEFDPGELFRLTCFINDSYVLSEQLEESLLNSVFFEARGYDPNALLTNPNSLKSYLYAMVTVRPGTYIDP